MSTSFIANGVGYDVPVQWTPGGPTTVVVLGALGTPASFYARLRDDLAGRGHGVALVEQRGLGDSALRASQEHTWGFADAVDTDLPAALRWIRDQASGQPVVLLGHSLGGHYAALLAGRHRELVDGLVLAACGSPWIELFEGPIREQIAQLVEVIPALAEQYGYYPGTQVGFGGDDARGVMDDWRHLALTNRYRLAGDDQSADDAIAEFTGPALVVGMAEDDFAPEKAVGASIERLAGARIDVHTLDTETIGGAADHFGWARRPAAIGELVDAWLHRNFGA